MAAMCPCDCARCLPSWKDELRAKQQQQELLERRKEGAGALARLEGMLCEQLLLLPDDRMRRHAKEEKKRKWMEEVELQIRLKKVCAATRPNHVVVHPLCGCRSAKRENGKQ